MNRRLLLPLVVLVALCALAGSADARNYGHSSGRHSGGCASGVSLVIVLVAIGITVAGAIVRAKRDADRGNLDVSVLRLGLDARVRAHVQGEMKRIAQVSNKDTQAGRISMLREVALTLRRARDSWVYAGVINAEPLSDHVAEPFFHDQVRRARDVTVRAEDDAGLVVVTIAVAARTTLIDFHDPADAEEVRRWLEAISQLTAAGLTLVEVVWSPAAEEDRLSSGQLESCFPEMKRIRGDTVEGKQICNYCSSCFPAELLSCPHCGASVKEAA